MEEGMIKEIKQYFYRRKWKKHKHNIGVQFKSGDGLRKWEEYKYDEFRPILNRYVYKTIADSVIQEDGSLSPSEIESIARRYEFSHSYYDSSLKKMILVYKEIIK